MFKINFSSLNIISFTLLISLFALGFVLYRGQDSNWDLLNYHFYTGYALLNGRNLQDISAAGLQSFLNPMPNALTYITLSYLPYPINIFPQLVLQLSSIPALFLIIRKIGNEMGFIRSGLDETLALFLCVASPLWWSELGTSFFSASTTPLILWSLFFVLIGFTRGANEKYFFALAGILSGLSVGLKFTNAPFAVAAFISFIFLSFKSKNGNTFRNINIYISSSILGFAITSWWNWYLYQRWESPIFPLFNGFFKSPYYDFINFRDERWRFSSILDFANYVMQSAIGTSKTSEILFADARIFFIFLLLPWIIFGRLRIKLGDSAKAVLIFIILGYALWATVFAYQRYLIPIELLAGVLIWILVLSLFKLSWVRILAMLSLTTAALFFMKIPDWGHTNSKIGEADPFSFNLPEYLLTTPSQYLVVGNPIAYLLPKLHPDSKFYGVNFSGQINQIVMKELSASSELPIRVIAKDSDAQSITPKLNELGFKQGSYGLECEFFTTRIGRYIVCDLLKMGSNLVKTPFFVTLGFSQLDYSKKQSLLWFSGLSKPESWGTWSEGNLVELGLTNCLPKGRVRLEIVGHAFGPNINNPFKIVLNGEEREAVFSAIDSNVITHFDNVAECTQKISIFIPMPKSPNELGQSTDSRQLGLGLNQIKISSE